MSRVGTAAARLFAALQRALSVLGQAWLVLGIALVLLWLVDQLLRAVLPAPAGQANFQPGAVAPDRARAAAVRDDDWIDAYWAEHEDARHTRWSSYVYWRRAPFDGELIDVDAHGFRVTPGGALPPARSIWLFGGSTAWGTGNRNGGTLAAQLEQVYRERSPELGVRVYNFAESGYVSRQSLAAFQSALVCPQPAADLAIFLDGANDVYAAVQAGQAGFPQNEENRRREFNSSRQLGTQLRAWALRLEGIARLAGVAAPAAGSVDALATDVAVTYLALAGQAAALAQRHGIDLLAAWQPTVFDRAQPRADEADIVGASLAIHVELQRKSRAALRERLAGLDATSVVDLGDVFDSSAEPLFFDFVHLSERGQRLLAERLYALSLAQLQRRSPRVPSVESCRDRPLG